MTAIAILLTATIEPGNVPFLKRADPEVRRRDYRDAFVRWLAAPLANPIVFCENSGADLSDFEELARTRRGRAPVEILSFRGQRDVNRKGKGYGELRIIEHALAASRLIADAPLVMKVTGRLYVANAAAILTRLGTTSAAVLCDLRQNLSVADTRVFCATPAFMRDYFVPRADEIDDSAGAMLEIVLARALHCGLADGATWRPLPLTPRWFGSAATADVPYSSSLIDWWYRELFRKVKTLVLAR